MLQQSIRRCPPGTKKDENSCLACPLGTYQPSENQPDCFVCPAGTSTRFIGATAQTQCENNCDSGYYRASTGACLACEKGTYKDNNDGLFQPCQQCPEFLTTAGSATTSKSQCSIRRCPPGTKRDENSCLSCPPGTYQPSENKPDCFTCPTGTSTRLIEATAQSQCETYCPSGQEKIGTACVSCPRGYYKDNNGTNNLFGVCMLCPADFITPTTGAKTLAECRIVACPKGTYIKTVSSSLVCELCPVGKYSDTVIQDVCTSCETAKTTLTTGTTTSLDCIDDCDAGYGYDTTVQACRTCPVNFFNSKADPYPNTCKLCPYNRTNTISGSADCSLTISDPVSPPVQLVTITVLTIYQLNVDNCDTFSKITSGIMRTQVKTKLVQIFEEKATGFANNWCSGVSCPNIDVVYTSCSAAVDASRRKRALVNSNFELIFRNISKLVTDAENRAVILAKEILAQTLMIKARSLDLEGGINFIGFERFVVSELCLPGQYRSGIECIPCPQGTYSLGGDHAQCTPCQLNYYQDLTGTAGCKPCPALKYTDTTGSVSSDVCKAQDEISLTKVIVPVVVSILVVVAVIVVVIAYRRGLFGKVFRGNRQRNSTNCPSQDTPRIPRIELPCVDLQRGSTNVSSDYCELDSVQRPASQDTPSIGLPYVDLHRGPMNVSSEYRELDGVQRPTSQDTPSTELPYVDLQRGSMNVSSEYSKLDSEQRPAFQYQTAREMYDNKF